MEAEQSWREQTFLLLILLPHLFLYFFAMLQLADINPDLGEAYTSRHIFVFVWVLTGMMYGLAWNLRGDEYTQHHISLSLSIALWVCWLGFLFWPCTSPLLLICSAFVHRSFSRSIVIPLGPHLDSTQPQVALASKSQPSEFSQRKVLVVGRLDSCLDFR